MSSAADWNAQIREQAIKEGKNPDELRIVPAEAAAAEKPKEEKTADEKTILTRTVEINGKEMEFRGETPEAILDQVVAAQNAVAPAKVEAEKPKPKELSKDQMFDIGLKLQQGDPNAITSFIEGSGLFDKWLEAKGIDIEAVKKTVSTTQSKEVEDKWATATAEFLDDVKAGKIDYPRAPQNKELMGITLVQLGLQPSKESMIKAFEHLKAKNMLFPEPKAESTKKPASGSTAFGASGGTRDRVSGPEKPQLTQEEFKKMTPGELTAWANSMKQKGINPDTVVLQ
jgi:hypothetical protein